MRAGHRNDPFTTLLALHIWTIGVLFLSVLACGGDRRSGAAPANDSVQVPTAGDTAGTSDTAVAVRDSAPPAARFDSTRAGADTATSVARQTPARKTAPKPASPKPAAPAQPAQPDTNTAAAAGPAPADTASAASAQTSDASAPLRDQYHQAPRDTVSQQVYDGWKQFNLNCARCHGEDVQGTTIAPHLIVSVKPDGPMNTQELFVQTVCAGRPEKGMPAWCPLGLEMDKIQAIYSYVKGRSEGTIHPGRPAVKAGG